MGQPQGFWGGARNYLGQLRLYSYADLLLLLAALGASLEEVIGGSLLWFGFLVYLDWHQQDRGRLRWPAGVWIVLWVLALALLHNVASVVCIGLACLYAAKKSVSWIAALSPVVNGLLKASIAAAVGGVSAVVMLGVFAIAATRNLLGDLRDVEKDRSDGSDTIPIRLGAKSDVRWAYPLGLATSSLIWTVAGELPFWALATAWFVEAATYRLTPR